MPHLLYSDEALILIGFFKLIFHLYHNCWFVPHYHWHQGLPKFSKFYRLLGRLRNYLIWRIQVRSVPQGVERLSYGM
jgi:hypothetical protein